MAGFFPPESFSPASGLELLPLRFEPIDGQGYLVSNVVGDFVRLSRDELRRIVSLDVSPHDGLYEKAFVAHLIGPPGVTGQKQLLAARLRSRMSFLQQPTGLHIFVVSLRCEHSCPYCQVSRQSTDKSRFDMSEETAERALRIALATPSNAIKIEFQGGEPLLNFGLIVKIVENAKSLANGKHLEFVIATNLALLSDEVLTFCKANSILLSTSLDGPADLHNKNRPRPGGNSHELAVRGIQRVQQELGRDRVSALMTTTEASLDRVEQIVDEYVRLELDGIFLRSLSPYGFAVKTKWIEGYDVRRWLEFYERGLRYILSINRNGRRFPEYYASLLLRRMLTDRPSGYVDLRSPAGIGLGALVYNYDGRVFVSDEARMLAEMGDDTFQLGHVNADTYRSLMLSDKLIDLVGQSLTQCAPICSECPYESHCGADPVFHYATQRDALGIKPLSAFCARQKGVMNLLLGILDSNSDDASILRSWGMQ